MNNYDYLLKFIIIGESSVGKSCLLLQFTEKRFRQQFDPTIGVEFGAQNIQVTDKIVRLKIWDTAGQESFKSITRSYYRGSIGSLLVYDVTSRTSFEEVQKWIQEIQKFGEEQIQMILVANKADLSHQRQVSYDDGQYLANQIGIPFIETSAKTGLNVDQAFQIVCQNVIDGIKKGTINPSNENLGIKVQTKNSKLKQSLVESFDINSTSSNRSSGCKC